MAVSGLAKEIPEARERNEDSEGVVTYRRRYLVKCTEANDDQNVALSAPGLPTRFMQYSTVSSVDLKARVIERTAKQVPGSFLHWHVDVTYSTVYGDQQRQEQDNPILEPAEFRFDFETLQVPIWYFPNQTVAASTAPGHAFSGPIVTAAGEVYDPPPMMDESRPVMTVTRNEASYNPALAVEFQNAINSDFFFGVQPRVAKIRSISGDGPRFKKDVEYWRVTYVIVFRREGWLLTLLNYGTYALTAAGSTTTVPFTNRDGTPRYGFLKSDGTALGPNPASSDIVAGLRTYRVPVEKPFSLLNLPFGVS